MNQRSPIQIRVAACCPDVASVVAWLGERGECAVLESSDGRGRRGRYTVVACEPLRVRAWGHVGAGGDPFVDMQRELRRCGGLGVAVVSGDVACVPPFLCGWIGYFGYDAGRYVERLGLRAERDIDLPVARFGLYDAVAVYDAEPGVWLIVTADLDESRESPAARAAFWEDVLRQACSRDMDEPVVAAGPVPVEHNLSYDAYLEMVERARQYIAAGDIFQVNLARRETYPLREAPWRTYLRLRQVNPAEYSAFLQWSREGGEGSGDVKCAGKDAALREIGEGRKERGEGNCAGRDARTTRSGEGRYAGKDVPRGKSSTRTTMLEDAACAVLSASPELFLDVRGREVVTRPIKGTRPRSADPVVDRAYRSELASSAKDRAELAMIVDLLRNDLGRVCTYGSVRVLTSDANDEAHPYVLETLPTVHHLVSTIAGRLRPEKDVMDLLRACFPGGSITGAPKVRSMEIIDEQEPTGRSVYTGSIGYLGLDGRATFNIAIRTLIATDGRVHLHAGGGIVADSDPEAEYEETQAKALGLQRALGADVCRTVHESVSRGEDQ